jgi:uncharacterized protein with PIN domain
MFEKTFNSSKFKYIEFFCKNCKTKGVSMDISKTRCPECNKTLNDIWEKEKYWSEKH